MIIAVFAVDKLWIRGHGMQTTGKPTEVLRAMLTIKKAETKARLMRAVKKSISLKDADWYKTAYEQVSILETTKRQPSKNMIYQKRMQQLADQQQI